MSEILDKKGMDDKLRALPAIDVTAAQRDDGTRDYYHRHPSGVKCIDVIEHMPLNVGTAMKYLWRCDEKHDDPFEDLTKAIWYINREIERRKRMQQARRNEDEQ